MNAEAKLQILLRAGSNVYLTKKQAAQLVGGRYRLDKLVDEKKIRAEKSGEGRMSPCRVNASDVFLYAQDCKSQRI